MSNSAARRGRKRHFTLTGKFAGQPPQHGLSQTCRCLMNRKKKGKKSSKWNPITRCKKKRDERNKQICREWRHFKPNLVIIMSDKLFFKRVNNILHLADVDSRHTKRIRAILFQTDFSQFIMKTFQ